MYDFDLEFNPRTALALATAADDNGWSRHDVYAAVADNDYDLQLGATEVDDLIDTDIDLWTVRASELLDLLIAHDYVVLPENNAFWTSQFITEMRKAALSPKD